MLRDAKGHASMFSHCKRTQANEAIKKSWGLPYPLKPSVTLPQRPSCIVGAAAYPLPRRFDHSEKLIPRYHCRPVGSYRAGSVLHCELDTLTDSSSVILETPARIVNFSVGEYVPYRS